MTHLKKLTAFIMIAAMLSGMTAAQVFAAKSSDVYVQTEDRVRELTQTSARLYGTAYMGAYDDVDFIECGIAVSKYRGDDTPDYVKARDQGGIELDVTGLTANTRYYYRAYIRYYTDAGSRAYKFGEEFNFRTLEKSSPSPSAGTNESTVNVPRISNLSSTEVLAESSFIANGNTVSYAGFVYSRTNENPTRESAEGERYAAITSSSNTRFSQNLTGLVREKTYYIRSYITVKVNGKTNDIYSDVISFTTSTGSVPVVYTDSVTNVNITGADVTINVAGAGNSAIVERGVVYSMSDDEPELYSTKSKYKTVSGAIGTAVVTLSDLETSKAYYVRAYVRNADDVYYGDVKRFVTQNEAGVTTETVVYASADTAVATGKIDDISSFLIQEKGFAYSKSTEKPTVNDLKVSTTANAVGRYELAISGLDKDTTYYVRAYVKTANTTSYGNTVTYSTGGDTATVSIAYRTVLGETVGTDTIKAEIGSKLTANNLNLPSGYRLLAGSWVYDVTRSETVAVLVTAGSQNTGAFMDGVGNYMFAPDRNTTRAEVAQVFYNLAKGQPTASPLAFSDVADNHSNKAAIDYVSAMGYMSGDPGGTFRPNDIIKRSEMCTVLTMVYGYAAEAANAETSDFTDVKPTDWFYHYVAVAYKYKIFAGYMDGGVRTFKPEQPIKRSEACTVFVNCEQRPLTPLGTAQFVDVPPSHWAYNYIMCASVPRP